MNSEALLELKREIEENQRTGTPERIEELRASVTATKAAGDAVAAADATLALARSLSYAADWKLATEGVRLLDELKAHGHGSSSELAALRCVGLLHAGAYLAARQAASALTLAEPTNPRGEALLELWKERALSEGTQALRIGGAVLAGVALVGLAVYFMWPSSRRGGGEARGGGRPPPPLRMGGQRSTPARPGARF